MKETHDWANERLTITGRCICVAMTLMVVFGILSIAAAIALLIILLVGATI